MRKCSGKFHSKRASGRNVKVQALGGVRLDTCSAAQRVVSDKGTLLGSMYGLFNLLRRNAQCHPTN